MITFDEAKELRHGEILIDTYGKRWKVNGAVKLWKTRPTSIRVPLKHGLYSYDALTDSDFDERGLCDVLTKGEPNR
jgi:hypothetical protein